MPAFTGDTTNASAVITAIAATGDLRVGMLVKGTGIPADAVILSIVLNTSITLSANATANGTGVSLTAQEILEMGADLISEPTVPDFEVTLLETMMAGADFRSTVNSPHPGLKLIDSKHSGATLRSTLAAPHPGLKLINTVYLGAALSSSLQCPHPALKLIDTFASGAFLESSASARGKLVGGSDTDGLSFGQLVDEVLSLWGITHRCSASDTDINRAINDINGALQTVWNNAEGRNYWSSATLEITLADGESSSDLPDDIQNVTGPCRISTNKRPLVSIGTIGELETFSDLYLDSDVIDEPVGYHIERLGQTGNTEGAKCIFHVAPAVSGDDVTFLVEVTKEAPRYSKYDIENSPLLPLPHSYCESLLLPVIRYKASAYHLFRSNDQKDTIDREYQQAAISLGLADPLPVVVGDNSSKGKTA